ncbi:MAG: efflux RND transporter permease subunit [Pseudomonadota bacterium]|nr:efflux RND transporter permease subunit [Pseudomonadota bacterium]MEC8233791.1 efflux RND transporter permease subunit [Pseudomonadota bacterium]MEE3007022.1 efflux RND transporter permease subunit [Pseudomonadota bacterium]|tara:strand:- start:2531 stop:5641 length:3111 start_codon:yes stop_codon:yes gene_type:complete
MFRTIVNFSLNNRLLVLAVAIVVIAYGLVSLQKLPVDVFPDLNKPTVTINIEAGGLAPEEVEQLVVFPIETAMNGIPGVTRVRSISGIGLGLIFVEFDWGSDIYLNRQLVTERLNGVEQQIPEFVEPVIGPISSIMGEILLVAMTSEAMSPMELRELADWTVRPKLLALPGVAQVIPIGGEVRQYRVTPNLEQMSNLGVSIEEIATSIEVFSRNAGGGFIDQNDREYLVRNIGRTTSISDLRELTVAIRDARNIRLDQVASIGFGARTKRGEAGFQGKPAVIVSVQKQPEIDTLVLTEKVELALAELQRTMKGDVKVDQLLFRQANFIENSIENLKTVLIEAAVVVAIILFAFLLNFRTTAISLLAIPISILVTILVFQFFGLTINTMTLGGLAIATGELVDDAVVDIENIQRRLKQNRQNGNQIPILKVIADASQEVRSGIVYATTIIVLVFVPLFALSGIEGRLFAPLGVAYIISIVASLLTAVTVTPVLASYLLPKMKNLEQRESFVVRFLKWVNKGVLTIAFRWSLVPIVASFFAVIVAVFSATTLPKSFLPPFNEGSLTVGFLLQPGVSLEQSNSLGQLAEKRIMQVPEVLQVGRRTGRAELDEHAEGVHSSEIDVDLKPSDRSRDKVIEDIRSKLVGLPVSTNVGQPISHRLDHLLSGIRAEIALKLFGDDLDTLRSLAEQLRVRISDVKGIVDLQVERQVQIPQIQVVTNYERARNYGISPSHSAQFLGQITEGRVLGEIIDGPRRFDLVLRTGDADRTKDGLSKLLIQTKQGTVPVSLIADVAETEGPNQVLRENGQRRIAVFGNTDGSDIATVVKDIRSSIESFELPPGYTVALEGTFKAREEATRLIALLAMISLSLIFIVLYTRYKSVALSLIIIGNVPLALIGSVAALHLSGQPLSLATMIGFITLAGIITRNGILKISHYINLVLHEGESFGTKMVLRGSQERLVPVLMTALSAGIALIPLVLGAGEPGKEILHPVAVVILGGLLSATLIDAVLTPILFLYFGKNSIDRLLQEQRIRGPQDAY